MNIPLPDEQTQVGIGKTRSASAYLEVGRIMKEDILLYSGAGPTASILDIGCGWGRIARHFVDYVEPPGRYVGMDVVKPFVDWCEENISPVNPAFSFVHQDIYNGLYNPNGTHEASKYVFPFEDESFDLIFLTSVFTHLLPDDAFNYLREIRRLLKPDGRCFSTWLLLGHDLETKYTGIQTSEGQVRYGFKRLLGMLEESGLTLAGQPVPRRWGGDKESPFRLQDLLLLERAQPGTQGSLLSRYETPPLPQAGEIREASGSVQSFDPVQNAVTLLARREVETFQLAEDTTIRANGREADSLALREGQWAVIQYGLDAQSGGKIATDVAVTDQPSVETVAGKIEVIDLERGRITLDAEREHITFEFDPDRVQLRVNRKAAEPNELKEGQRASFQYVPRAVAINSRDLEPSTGKGPTTRQAEAVDEA